MVDDQRMPTGPFAHLLVDHDQLLHERHLTQGRRRIRRRRVQLGQGVLEEGQHVGQEFLKAFAWRETNFPFDDAGHLSIRPQPRRERGPGETRQPGRPVLGLTARHLAEPHAKRRDPLARNKRFRRADLEKIDVAPADEIVAAAGRPRRSGRLSRPPRADYFADYVGGCTLRHGACSRRPRRGFSRGYINPGNGGEGAFLLAEREGFEPPVRLHVLRISSAARSTTLPPLRRTRRRSSRHRRGVGAPLSMARAGSQGASWRAPRGGADRAQMRVAKTRRVF